MASPKAKKSKEKSSMSFGAYIRRYWQLYLLLLLPMLYLLIFKYIPMIYIQIAFKKYSIVQSVWKMSLAANHGFQYFIQAFADRDTVPFGSLHAPARERMLAYLDVARRYVPDTRLRGVE